MKTSEAVTVINTICDKLGIACKKAVDFVPAIARYEIHMDIYAICVSAFLITISIIGIALMYNHIKKILPTVRHADRVCDCGGYLVVLTVGIILISICVLCQISTLSDLIGWVNDPNAKAVMYIIDSLQT